MLDEWTTPQFFVVTKQIDGLRCEGQEKPRFNFF